MGPLGRVLSCDGHAVKAREGFRLGEDSNARILLRQVAFVDGERIWKDARRALLNGARDTNLGQEPALVSAVAARRQRAVELRLRQARAHGGELTHRRLLVSPEWRLVTGVGERDNAHEIGIALHGTYGWPVIPGSTLKGVTRAWARERGVDPAAVQRIFGGRQQGSAGEGAERDDEPGEAAGTVDVLDALPAGKPVSVAVDVVTPHTQPYHGGMAAPGEWHNPVPSFFLVVRAGSFAVDLIGPGRDVDLAAELCAEACDELGVGAKTGAGYGYLSVETVS